MKTINCTMKEIINIIINTSTHSFISSNSFINTLCSKLRLIIKTLTKIITLISLIQMNTAVKTILKYFILLKKLNHYHLLYILIKLLLLMFTTSEISSDSILLTMLIYINKYRFTYKTFAYRCCMSKMHLLLIKSLSKFFSF